MSPRILALSDSQIGAGRTLGITLDDHERWLQQIVAYAESIEPDLCIHAGDVFENRQTNRDQDEVFLRFALAISRVCPMLVLAGNHDWRGYERATTVGIFRANRIEIVDTPRVVRYGSLAVACLPHADKGYLVASRNGSDRESLNAEVAEHLVTIAAGLRGSEECQDAEYRILAAHWMVSGATLPTGLDVDRLSNPVLDLGALDEQRWDAVVLGDIHSPQLLPSETPAFYCGAPYPCDWGDADEQHGVWTLEADPATRNAAEKALLVPSFVPLDTARLVKIGLHFDSPPNENVTWFEDVADAIVRVTITGPHEHYRQLDVGALRRRLIEDGARHVHIDDKTDRPERARVQGLTEDLDELTQLEMWMDAEGLAPEKRAQLRGLTERMLAEVRS